MLKQIEKDSDRDLGDGIADFFLDYLSLFCFKVVVQLHSHKIKCNCVMVRLVDSQALIISVLAWFWR